LPPSWWKASLKWQRLKPYEKFAEMIERHWDGIVAYCKPENKVSLGFVEGLNNKIRVIQHRAYGLRDEEYLRLKILTSMLPKL
jgi:transposase